MSDLSPNSNKEEVLPGEVVKEEENRSHVQPVEVPPEAAAEVPAGPPTLTAPTNNINSALQGMGVDPSQLNPQNLVQMGQQALSNAGNYLTQTQPQQMVQDAGFVAQEAGTAVVGGALDAVDSAGNFVDLAGDTAKLGLNSILGKPTDSTQDFRSADYKPNEISWLDIPEDWKPENRTGLGKFSRGLVEFGLLAWAGGAALAPVKGAAATLPGLRSANAAIQGNKYLRFIDKGANIFAEGAIADLISNSSEAGNIANLAEEHVPWLAPDIMKALSVDPDDNIWLAKVKTITAGGGMNHVGHFVGAFAKGLWKFKNLRAKGVDVDQAREAANIVYRDELAKEIQADEITAAQKAAENYTEGKGVSRADPRREHLRKHLSEEENVRYDDQATDAADRELLDQVADAKAAKEGDEFFPNEYQSRSQAIEGQNRSPDPFVNPEQFNTPERATYRAEPDAGTKHVTEALVSSKKGGDGRSYTPIASESQIRAISRGNASWREYVEQALGRVTDEAFRDLDNRLSHAEVKDLILKQAAPMMDAIEDFQGGKGGNLADTFKKALDDPKNNRVYTDDGVSITTSAPSKKGANVIALNALGRLISDISTGAYHMSDKVQVNRQVDMVLDAMKVLLVENKKLGMMWGLDGKQQQWGFKLPRAVKEITESRIKAVEADIDEFITNVRKLQKEGRWEERRALMELYELSDGRVREIQHIYEFLRAKKWGGRMDDIHIKGKARQLLQGSFFNSILGAPRTIRKAVFGTNTIAMMRPFVTWGGTKLPWVQVDPKQAAIAAVQVQSIGRAWGESWQMAKRNWELGVSKKNQDYQGKFELEADLEDWKSLKPYYEKFGGDLENTVYDWMDKVVDFNTNPWVKYSQNAMGAGDAFARTIIGRQRMAMKSAIDAIERGADLEDLGSLVAKTEEGMRKEIFDQNADGFWVVKDKAASMAGDEAAMTKGLQENFKGFEQIARIPGMKMFFPLVRPGFNFLDVSLGQHTPAMIFRDKYKDLVAIPKAQGKPPSQLILDKYGLKANEVAQEVALIEGRIALGTAVIGMGGIAAANGLMTGSYPHDKKERDHWIRNKIVPNAFKFGDVYVPFIDNMLVPEVFAPLMTMVANAFSYQDVLGEKPADQWGEKLRWMAASLIVDQSMLAGIGDLALLMDPNAGGLSKVKYTASKLARAHFPFAALSGTLGNIIDPTVAEANTLWELIGKKDVVAKSFLPPKYDVLAKNRTGKPVTYGPENGLLRLFNTLSPIAVVPADGDPLKKTLQEIRFNMAMEFDQIGGVDLTSQERSELQRILATGTLRRDLLRVINTRAFKESLESYKRNNHKISDDWKVVKAKFYLMVHEEFQRHKKMAREQMIRENPHLAARISLKERKEQILRTNASDARINAAKKIEKLLNLQQK